ncbi:MAG: fumarate hydratase [Firmicutes bacterium]|nr:fumarate hydratase [Bacillota bacterium]HXL04048.1 fumarate hydratase [Bacillota bacterium]
MDKSYGRTVDVSEITQAVKKLAMNTTSNVPKGAIDALERAYLTEESPVGKEVIKQILENHRIAREESVPACQDTGVAMLFLEVGQDTRLTGGDLYEAINEGVRQGYIEGYLRKSIVTDPLFERVNTGDNTPAVIYVDIVPGTNIKITFAAKGGGAENMSGLVMLPPAAGVEGVKKFVIDQVRKAGPNPCPPIVVGVGIGGTFDRVALLAKKAVLRDVGESNAHPKYAQLEKELLEEINKLGIGPQGFGGRTTALAVNVEFAPCHIASLPVACNLNCHAGPHDSIVL